MERLNEEVSKLYSNNTNINTKIHIMTIHKSKGLEFDHVVLPELQKKSANDSGQLLQWLERANSHGEIDLLLAPITASGAQSSGIYQYIAHTENSKLAMESTRLLYVACTRAKKTLHLAFQFNEKMKQNNDDLNIPSRSHLNLLWPLYQQQWLEKISLPAADQDITFQPFTHTRLPLNELKKSEIILKNTGTDNHTELDYSLNTTPELPRIIGNIIHVELQKASEFNELEQTLEDKQKQWIRQLKQQNVIDTKKIAAAVDKIHQAIINTQSCPQGQWILSKQHDFCASEFSIHHYRNGTVNHYIIDRIIIEKDTVWIIDYKTGQPEKNEAQWIKDEIEVYRVQLYNYQRAIKPLYPKHKIKLSLYFPLCHTKWHQVDTHAKTHPHAITDQTLS